MPGESTEGKHDKIAEYDGAFSGYAGQRLPLCGRRRRREILLVVCVRQEPVAALLRRLPSWYPIRAGAIRCGTGRKNLVLRLQGDRVLADLRREPQYRLARIRPHPFAVMVCC